MADLKPISQFATASSVEANTLLFVSTPNQNNGYDSEKVSASELGEALVNDFEYTQDLATVSKKVTGAINENKSVIGYSYDEYDPTTAYAKDDLCIYNNALYKALQATTGNLPTNTTYWEPTSIADEIDELKIDNEYQIGDTVNISNIQCVGILTTGQKSIYIQIPLPKPISNSVSTITVNPNSLWYIRHSSGGYILNNQTLSSIGTVTVNKNISGVFIGLDLTNAFVGAPNNSPVVISLGSDNNNIITFS